MENLTNTIPTIDLSVFLLPTSDDYEHEVRKKMAKEIINKACREYGFFQAVNHGIPLDLMTRSMDLSKSFFGLTSDEKLKFRPRPDAPVPAGYGKQPEKSSDKNEFLMMLPPHNSFNVLPDNPPGFREALEEMFKYLSTTCGVIENILNDCLGLPPNFLKEYNEDRNFDLMTTKRYFPATETENIGIFMHEDSNMVSLIFQDEVGGLEVLKDGIWIPVVPSPGTIVVNVGDTFQVLSNVRVKSATHRVTRQEGRSRHSFSFFYNLQGDKWVEPLPHFTTRIGESPKYRGFEYKEYLAQRIRNKTHPPSRPEDEINMTHYEVHT